MKKLLSRSCFFVLLSITTQTFAQNSSLFIPRNMVTAYEKGTRSYDGKPGPNYWVNHTDYKIKVELFPETRTIKGHEWVTFHNESPDSLNSFVIRLYQDIMKKGNERDHSVDTSDVTQKGVNIDTLIIGGVGVDFDSREYRVRRSATNLSINGFPVKAAPKGSIAMEAVWSLQIPEKTHLRMGEFNDSTFYVAYWYPQVAVYDDIDGWDRIEYGGSVEFYNDINNFDFEVTVPDKYLVWASGEIQNAEDNLQPEIYERYKKTLESDDVVRIITEDDYKNNKVLNGTGKHTWHFIANNVSDVSFAACTNYLWDGVSSEVDLKGRRVLTDAIYPPGRKFQDEVAFFAKLAIQYFSNQWPGVPYPFPKVTVFNGEARYGGGMEMPMMCNNGTYRTRGGTIGVTVHEIAHSYFPFYMGTNERKYAWMDEGWATFLTFDLVRELEPEEDELPGNVSTLNYALGTEMMLPLITPSYSVSTRGSGIMFYPQTAVAYLILKDFLGEELFGKCLHEYISRWNGKHPLPYDFFFTFDNVTKEDLSWFWKPWFFERGFPDNGIKNVKNGNEIIIEKIGNYPVPLDLKVTYSDDTNETIHRTAAIWKDGAKEISVKANQEKKIKKVEIVTLLGPDVNSSNNTFEVK